MVKLIHLLFLLFCFCSTYQKFLSSGGGNGQRRALNLPPRNGSRRPIPGKKEEKKEYSTGLLPKPKKQNDSVPFPISLIYQESDKVGGEQIVDGIYECFMKKMKNGKRKYEKYFDVQFENVLAKTQRNTREGKIYRFFYQLNKKGDRTRRFVAMDFRCDAENDFNGVKDIKLRKFYTRSK